MVDSELSETKIMELQGQNKAESGSLCKETMKKGGVTSLEKLRFRVTLEDETAS